MKVLPMPRGLASRMAGALALALLPIGGLSMLQSVQVAEVNAKRQEIALLALTAEAASNEAQTLSGARGLVAALVAQVATTRLEPEGPDGPCSALFERVKQDTPAVSFVGFVGRDGFVKCGSSAVGMDVRHGVLFATMEKERQPRIVVNAAPPISGVPVVVIGAPVIVDNDYKGFIALSLPQDILSENIELITGDRPLSLVTFNGNGEILSAEGGMDAISPTLPSATPLKALVSERQIAFTGTTIDGSRRTFAVVPIIPGTVYALGSWEIPRFTWENIAPFVYPALMLAAGLLASFLAMQRLVIRNIRNLARNMHTFSETREFRPLSTTGRLSAEFEDVDTEWHALAQRLLMDEAELEHALHEKNVLLKEVHHRVKNNLQLIASIVNMKLRRATSNEARTVLKEVQGRVMSIASVHRALYSGVERGGRLRLDELLRSVITATIDGGLVPDRRIAITRSFDEIHVFPDQAVPILLMASEAVTNALKYMGRLEDGTARLDIALTATGPGTARLTVENTRGTPFLPPEQVRGSGLGQSLLQGFTTQIGGTLSQSATEDWHHFALEFRPAPFEDEPADMTLELDPATPE